MPSQRRKVAGALGSLALLLASTAHAAPRFGDLVKAYYDAEAAAHPVTATALGLHGGDSRMDDQSAAAHQAEIARLHATLTALAGFDAASLQPGERDDRDVLSAQIDGQLLEEERIQQWRHNPDVYVSLATQGPYTIIARDFAPPAQRMAEAAAREEQIPALFETARANLVAMPPVFIEIALEDVHGAISFLRDDVPAAFKGVADPKARAALAKSTPKAVAASQDFEVWLKARRATAHGSFVLGTDNFRRLLASDMIDLPPDDILAAGRAQLAKDRAAFLAVSRTVDPKRPSHALNDIERDHPDGGHLTSTAAGQLAHVQAFIADHKILDLPSRDLPKVEDTPPFQRAIIFGEMDWPGPFETVATQAYYYITPPDASKSKAEQDAYLAYFNRSLLLNLSVHEALPGHFTQYLFRRAHPEWSIVRKVSQSYTATEGWAHYTEQMMVDEGLNAGDPKLHLAQLQDALLRDCRLVTSVEMHTHGMPLADATKLMADQCFQPQSVAYKEARRGTSDPGYFSYTLGKLMILKLRQDVEAKEGKNFSLARFHDRFLGSGLIPLKVIRREMTGQDGKLL